MPRKESEAVPKGNVPTPQDAYEIITWKKFRQVLLETWGEAFGEYKEDLRRMDQRLASLEQNARQLRLAMGVNVPADKKTRERTEGAANAVQAQHGDSCSAKRIQAGPTCSTNFGVKAEPPALYCRDDVLIENGAAVPKSCL